MAEYISTEGMLRLEAELKNLLEVERPGVVNNVAAAAAEGDRSENAEYIYGKKRLRQIDKRIEFLTRRLDVLVPVSKPSTDARVVFLSWVEVEDQDGATRWFRIVGAEETDAKTGWISLRSPVGRALLGRELDDDVHIETPGGTKELLVTDIRLTAPD